MWSWMYTFYGGKLKFERVKCTITLKNKRTAGVMGQLVCVEYQCTITLKNKRTAGVMGQLVCVEYQKL